MADHQIYTLSSSTATRIVPAGAHSGYDITIQNNNASGYVYVGAEGVTTTNYGFRILPSHSISFELPSKDALYIIGSANGLTAAVLRMGLESKN